jgi:hypothetical protein
MENAMRLWTKIGLALLFVPLVASAQFSNLDAAMSNLNRGFGGGDVQAIVAGIGDGEQVMLQFPGLIEQSGFFGKDQAAYLLDGLFNKAKPTNFEPTNSKKVSGKSEQRELYIALRAKGDRWSVASVRSASK